jgi:hypothetical protein
MRASTHNRGKSFGFTLPAYDYAYLNEKLLYNNKVNKKQL